MSEDLTGDNLTPEELKKQGDEIARRLRGGDLEDLKTENARLKAENARLTKEIDEFSDTCTLERCYKCSMYHCWYNKAEGREG